MREKVSPGDVGASHGTDKSSSADVSGATYHKPKTPAKDPVFDTCREEMEAKNKRRVAAQAKLAKAAKILGGFSPSKYWGEGPTPPLVKNCSQCGREVFLYACSLNAYTDECRIEAKGNCPDVPAINQWLRDEGYAS